MRLSAVLCLVLLSGCFTELLVASDVNARNIACRVVDPETEVTLVHHGEPHVDAEAASQFWIEAMVVATKTDPSRFSVLLSDDLPEGTPDRHAWAEWIITQPVFEGGVRLHIVWTPQVAGFDETMDVFSPGFVAINTTAIREAGQAGRDEEAVAGTVLAHALGHAMGVVNRGIPLHTANTTGREATPGHEAGGIMAPGWHRVSEFPNATTNRYSDVVAGDWNAAAADPKVCP